MKSLYDFIVSPLEGRYNNTKKIGGKTLIINTKIETFKNVSKEAMVIEVPAAYKTKIKKMICIFAIPCKYTCIIINLI